MAITKSYLEERQLVMREAVSGSEIPEQSQFLTDSLVSFFKNKCPSKQEIDSAIDSVLSQVTEPIFDKFKATSAALLLCRILDHVVKNYDEYPPEKQAEIGKAVYDNQFKIDSANEDKVFNEVVFTNPHQLFAKLNLSRDLDLSGIDIKYKEGLSKDSSVSGKFKNTFKAIFGTDSRDKDIEFLQNIDNYCDTNVSVSERNHIKLVAASLVLARIANEPFSAHSQLRAILEQRIEGAGLSVDDCDDYKVFNLIKNGKEFPIVPKALSVILDEKIAQNKINLS